MVEILYNKLIDGERKILLRDSEEILNYFILR